MIKNYDSLIRNSEFPRQTKKALQIVETGIKAVDAKKAIAKTQLPTLKKFDKVFVIGFGKATGEMAQALERRIGENVHKGTIVSIKKAKTKKIQSLVGTHPFPTAKNVKAAKKICSIAEEAGKNDLVICLVSGGGSTLLTLPVKGINLKEMQKTNKLLLHSRATIKEVNCVRKHLSKVKGGRLMEAVQPATLYTITISDVTGDDLETIASGPTTADKTTFKQAINTLKKYRLWNKTPKGVRKHLNKGAKKIIPETPKTIFKKVHNKIILNNLVAIKAMKKKANSLGFKPIVYSTTLKGEAKETGKKLVAVAKKRKAPVAIIAGGETTVKVTGRGKGGRNQELVLGSLKELSKLEKAVFISIGTDGIDGESKAAGAIADSTTLKKALSRKFVPGKYLKRNDSNKFFKKIKGEIITGPTGTNVSDLQLLLCWN